MSSNTSIDEIEFKIMKILHAENPRTKHTEFEEPGPRPSVNSASKAASDDGSSESQKWLAMSKKGKRNEQETLITFSF